MAVECWANFNELNVPPPGNCQWSKEKSAPLPCYTACNSHPSNVSKSLLHAPSQTWERHEGGEWTAT